MRSTRSAFFIGTIGDFRQQTYFYWHISASLPLVYIHVMDGSILGQSKCVGACTYSLSWLVRETGCLFGRQNRTARMKEFKNLNWAIMKKAELTQKVIVWVRNVAISLWCNISLRSSKVHGMCERNEAVRRCFGMRVVDLRSNRSVVPINILCTVPRRHYSQEFFWQLLERVSWPLECFWLYFLVLYFVDTGQIP